MQLPSWPVAFPAMLPLCFSLEAPPGQLDHLEALSLPQPLACSVTVQSAVRPATQGPEPQLTRAACRD